ncbi:MAG: tetratricopeptide repeat protein, partial [Candidatus Omnitrophota bacterium]|nr:tetratricopeptide repeat protein [Candidatus Omnitrophota bacterium]
MKKILAFSFLVFLISAGVLIAAEIPEELYRKGNSSYENGDYGKAVSFYEELVKMDRVSPEVFYNLGNSYFKLKKTGKAVLNYERALRLDSRDRDIQLNLRLTRSMAVDKINAPERGFVLAAILFLYDRMAVNELTAACSFFYLAVIFILIFSIFFVAKRKNFVY